MRIAHYEYKQNVYKYDLKSVYPLSIRYRSKIKKLLICGNFAGLTLRLKVIVGSQVYAI